MNRRDSLKAIGLTAISAGIVLEACKSADQKNAVVDTEKAPGRQDFELERDKKLQAETFFSAHEMATISLLADLIIPKDDKSGGALEAKVPEFIEFIVKDIPSHQIPMRGGLKWLDLQCLKRYQKTFKDAGADQKIEMLDAIAYPKLVEPGMEQGAAFFSLMRDLTASGFYTSEIGVRDLGYVGNVPNQWTGVPADVLKQYGLEGV
jgi:hypothetical protein